MAAVKTTGSMKLTEATEMVLGSLLSLSRCCLPRRAWKHNVLLNMPLGVMMNYDFKSFLPMHLPQWNQNILLFLPSGDKRKRTFSGELKSEFCFLSTFSSYLWRLLYVSMQEAGTVTEDFMVLGRRRRKGNKKRAITKFIHIINSLLKGQALKEQLPCKKKKS